MAAGHSPLPVTAGAERELIARIAAGDRVAEREFVRQYERGVRVLVRRYCRPLDPVVDDLVQDVLSGVLERLRAGAIHEPAALPGYVQSAVVYATSAEYRRRRPAQPEAAIEEIADGETPSSRLDADQLSGLLRGLLDEMPVERDREILRRFYLEEEEKDSLCAALRIEPAHFHRVMFRARERFRTLLERAGFNALSEAK